MAWCEGRFFLFPTKSALQKLEAGRSCLRLTVDRGPRAFGCTWACLVRML